MIEYHEFFAKFAQFAPFALKKVQIGNAHLFWKSAICRFLHDDINVAAQDG